MVQRRTKSKQTTSRAERAMLEGWHIVRQHPLFAPITMRASFMGAQNSHAVPKQGWAQISRSGQIYLHATRIAEPEEWAYVIAHLLLHLGFGHFQKRENWSYWNIACDCVVAKFLGTLKFGKIPEDFCSPIDFVVKDEESLYLSLCALGVKEEHLHFGVAGSSADMLYSEQQEHGFYNYKPKWSELFSEGLSQAVGSAVRVASGHQDSMQSSALTSTCAQRAKEWFISSYPMLGALACAFKIIEDADICRRHSIAVAAVDAEIRELYINPHAALDEAECRFVMAHELLHVGLRHQARRQGRDPFYWNVACDYLINGWLMEMQVGDFPRIGGLLDFSLKGLSAESIYDRIVSDLRMYRKLATFRGLEECDILEGPDPDWWSGQAGRSLDVFYREALSQGLLHHQQQSRGLVPAGLIEEIRALSQPAIAWDVELARWFDNRISPSQKHRTYSRASRRQSSTPNIARPAWYANSSLEEGRTFGVVLDTSGSMDRKLLAKALGTICSYSISRDVMHVRVIFCDASYYDQGYMAVDEIAGRVKVRGRGGTTLQPALTFLESAADFPKQAPILIITDGLCDVVSVRREHAYLMPYGSRLPFLARGEVFRVR